MTKIDFIFSTDFYAINAKELSHTCMHLLCTAGEGSFVFNEKCYHIGRNDLVVIPMPDRMKNLAGHPDLQVEWFAADYKFLQNLLPSNNYSIGGYVYSLSYTSLVTASSHSLLAPSCTSLWYVKCWNQLSLAAPCQCFTSAGMAMTVPGVITSGSLPHS